jgi:predicted ATPase/class 3 adenylate cyclase/Tfp pilus assembly protein PilF
MSSHALLFTDVVDSTTMVARMGDEQAAAIWAEHDRRARRLTVLHRGREIDRSDGVFLIFESVADAAAFAQGYHAALAEIGLAARAGIHFGAVSLRRNTPEDVAAGAKPLEVDGLAKPIAARIMSLASGGRTLLSASAAEALGRSGAFALCRQGYYRFKGVDEPQLIVELGGDSAPPPPDSEKAYRVVDVDGLWMPVREIGHNLAPERDAFVGRRTELTRLAHVLDTGVRLVTLLGPGGTGKTRLVCRYARAWLGEWTGGVWFCDLSEAHSMEGLCFAVAQAVGVSLGRDDPVARLGHAIAGRGRCLVVLDNVEQLAAHAAATLARWLDRATAASFVVTTRELLHLPGEEVFQVEPLDVDSEAIELFVTRARAQRPTFALDAAVRAQVAELVRLLDGLPLAIELAAARVRVLSPAQILERLRDRFSLLAGARGAAARHATLKAAIDWSWDLLAPFEQAALAQCSVFEGGFTMQAAEAVLSLSAWPDAPRAMDVVQALVDKSLLRAWWPNAASRLDFDEPFFGMYISVHEYAAEKLAHSGSVVARLAQESHGRYFAHFGTDDAIHALWTHGGVARAQMLAIELDNLVVALRRALTRGDGATAVYSFAAAWHVLAYRGPFSLGLPLSESVLALPELPVELRILAMHTRASALWRNGRMEAAQALLLQVLESAREAGNKTREGQAHHSLGIVYQRIGQMAESEAQYEAALPCFRASGDLMREGMAVGGLANVHALTGRTQSARPLYEAALAIHREVGNVATEGAELANLGAALVEQGHVEAARSHLEQSIVLLRQTGVREGEAAVLVSLSALACNYESIERAMELLEQALSIAREVGARSMQGSIVSVMAQTEVVRGRWARARALGEEALEILREVINRREEALTMVALGSVAHQERRLDDARRWYEQALDLQRATDDPRSQGVTLGAWAALELDLGRIARAQEHASAGEALLREAGDRLALASLLCVSGHIALAERDTARAQEDLHEAEETAQSLQVTPESQLGQDLLRLRAALS